MAASVSERERLAALASYDILDTPPEASFDRITRLMGWTFEVPTAMVAFMDAERLWVKATTGRDTSLPREQSFCMHVVMGDHALAVEDARRDPRFADLSVVAGPSNVRAYAGAPLRTPDGIPIGAVSLYDTSPRSFSESTLSRLRDFADLTTDVLERRRASLPERREPTEQARSRPVQGSGGASLLSSEADLLARLTSDGLLRLGSEGRIEWVNDRFVEMSGYAPDELRDRRPSQLLHGPATDEEAVAYVRRCVEHRESFSQELLNYRKSGAQYWVQAKGEPLYEDGNFAGFLVVESDITEERHREDALVSLTSFYERALTELPIEVAVMDPEGRYLFLNPAAVSDEDMREWLIGKTAVDYARRRGLDPAPFEERVAWIRDVVAAAEPD